MPRDAKSRRSPTGPDAARLRQRKYALMRRFRLPDALEALLPGTLTLSTTRCGKPTCHCARGEGHPAWSFTFMLDGTKHVERIPREWIDDVGRRVEAGRAFLEAVREVLAANAQLLILARTQRRR